MADPRSSGRALDQLAELEEERRYLLRSLQDLEREHDAGDVDDDDYATLKDDYTVRASDVLRQIDEGQRQLAPKPPQRWGRRILTSAAAIVVTVVIAWVLTQAWGERGSGDEITGFSPGDEVRELLTNARAQMMDPQRLPQANELFLRAVELEEERGVQNPEPLTYYAWTLALGTLGNPDQAGVSGQLDVALLALDRATQMDPDYPDPHCFIGIIEFRFRDDPAAAAPFVDTCLANNPPSDVEGLVSAMNVDLRAALADDAG